MTRPHALEAPHRRREGPPRIVEKATIWGYKATAFILSHLPPRPAWVVIGTFSKAGYLLWPTKRRWVNANFGHVLGKPPGDRAVRALALRAYGHYARYLVELMRLPSMPADLRARLVDPEGIARLETAFRASNGLILSVGHIGNNEACAAGVASRGWPISVVADDSTFPEMFELLKQQRESWGVSIIPWRNLRAVYAVLRRKEILGLLVDWGYRPDGIPVKLFDAWTTLPSGPATLAAKTGASIVPVTLSRMPDGRFTAVVEAPIAVESAAPAHLWRATQAMADALAREIAVAPDQWYSFKPIWPATEEECARLEARARQMQAQTSIVTPSAAVEEPPMANRPRVADKPGVLDRPLVADPPAERLQAADAG